MAPGAREHIFIEAVPGSVTLVELKLNEMTWLDPAVGVVPGDEKADPGNTITLAAQAP